MSKRLYKCVQIKAIRIYLISRIQVTVLLKRGCPSPNFKQPYQIKFDQIHSLYSIADRASQLYGVLCHCLRTSEPVSAEKRATTNGIITVIRTHVVPMAVNLI